MRKPRAITAFAVLSALSVTALLGVHTRAQNPMIEWPHSTPQGAPVPGQEAFDRVCKVCHGPEGRGDGAPRLVPFSREYDEVIAIVREGTGQMPPISARELPDDDVTQIVAYLKSLSR